MDAAVPRAQDAQNARPSGMDAAVPRAQDAQNARPSGMDGAEPAVAIGPGTVHETTFTDLLANGQAVGRIGTMVTFVDGPLPGERARIRITQVKPKYAVGDLIELVERSPERVVPFCDVFGTCGGCQVQHLGYEGQLSWKTRIVREALQRIGGIADPPVAPAIGMDQPRAYRNKMALVAKSGAFGFYKARSHELVPIRHCPIVLASLDAQIGNLWRVRENPAIAPALRDVKHVIARAAIASGDVVVSFTTDRGSAALAAAAAPLAAAFPEAVGISNSFEPASTNAVMGRRHRSLSGRADIAETIDGVSFRVSPASFFQVNSAMVRKIFGYLRERVAMPAKVLDLYCGAGTFTLFFARGGATVVGVEENPHAIREARENAALNHVEATTAFLAGRVDTVLGEGPGRAALASADIVFLDPPRKGSDEATLALLAAARVPEIWYLSCNPATLARDLAQLVAAGYGVESVQPFDMFPQTGHIEALAVAKMSG
jgi:23S rRNA (uracil1939-C5)-methyltransferase